MSTNGRDRFLAPSPSGLGSEYAGWQEPLPDLVARLQARIAGLRARLNQPSTEVSIWPSAVAGRHIFTPETSVVQVDTAQTNLGTNPVNVVVRSGKTTNIRIIFPGPGVFVGRWLKCSLFMRLHNPQMRGDSVTWLPIVSNTGALGSFAVTPALSIPFTTRFSVFPVQPQVPFAYGTVLAPFRPPALNYFWNIKDERSGRHYADQLVSHMMLLPSTWQQQGPGASPGMALADGDLFDLKAPWVFERDGQVTFKFRPITDLYQFDSSIAGTAAPMSLPFDDRENGQRNQSVLVQVEMHGYRFETMQDAVHAGAITQIWDDDSNGAPIPKGAARLARKGEG